MAEMDFAWAAPFQPILSRISNCQDAQIVQGTFEFIVCLRRALTHFLSSTLLESRKIHKQNHNFKHSSGRVRGFYPGFGLAREWKSTFVPYCI